LTSLQSPQAKWLLGSENDGPAIECGSDSLKLLAIETSCDETSAAVVCEGVILSNVVSSQIKMHAEYGGVVPELATREHLRNLTPVCNQALELAGTGMETIDAIAATQGPGLPSALLIGLYAAEALAFSLRKPFVPIHHHEAHLYSAWVSGDPLHADFSSFAPSVSLIVSGGHTLLVLVEAELKHRVLGGTIDDAAGECFDKIAKLIGLPYPGGPELDRLAQSGNPRAHAFPRPLIHDSSDDFSFSGLKTAVRYFLRDHPETLNSRAAIQDLCASVQAAIAEVLVKKTVRAATRAKVGCVTASGGVMCNRELRAQLASACARAGLNLKIADRMMCTDNAGMVGVLAERKLLRGLGGDRYDFEIAPGMALV
jgi:N6-L-threonylcarbamoyladenine synthase